MCPVFVLAQELSELSWGMTSTIMHIEEGVLFDISAEAEDRYDYLCHKKKKEELRSIVEGQGWPVLI